MCHRNEHTCGIVDILKQIDGSVSGMVTNLLMWKINLPWQLNLGTKKRLLSLLIEEVIELFELIQERTFILMSATLLFSENRPFHVCPCCLVEW